MNNVFLSEALPDINTINSYTVKELKQELKNIKEEQKSLDSKSKIYHTILYICHLISINKKNFTSSQFSEYKETDNTPVMLGEVHVSTGAMAIYSVAINLDLNKSS